MAPYASRLLTPGSVPILPTPPGTGLDALDASRGKVVPPTFRHKDAGTNDFLTGLMEQHEKMTWMLRAFLEGKSG